MKAWRDGLLGTIVAITVTALSWGLFDSGDEPLRAVRSDRRIETTITRSSAASVPTQSRAKETFSSAAWPEVIVPMHQSAWPKPLSQGLTAWGEPTPPPPPPPPAPAPPAVAVPSVPQAPPFPYELIGILEEATGRPQALLNGSMRVLAVQAGEVIDGQWQVESIHAGRLSLRWLPSNLPLSVGYRTPRP